MREENKAAREEKANARWSSMLDKQAVKIELLKASGGCTKLL
jgi:hypothetical protein